MREACRWQYTLCAGGGFLHPIPAEPPGNHCRGWSAPSQTGWNFCPSFSLPPNRTGPAAGAACFKELKLD